MKAVLCVSITLCISLFAVPSSWLRAAQSPSSKPTQENRGPQEEHSPAHKYFSDVVLVNQHGQKMRFYTDLLKGKVVVVSTFFTSCSGVCPLINQKLVKIQDALGDRLGQDVHLISLSVDPTTDTPPRLKEYADRFHTRPGWYFLTGEKANVDFALHKLGQSAAVKEAHTNVIIVGNESTGLWKKMFGLAKTEELIKIVQGVLNDR